MELDKQTFYLIIVLMKLQFNIEKLPPEGGKFNIIFNKDDIGVTDVRDNIEAEISIERSGNVFKSKGHLEYDLNLECSRCLTNFTLHHKGEFEYEFKRASVYGRPPIEIDARDRDYLIVNNIIDFKPHFYDLVILSIPMKPLCREDCKGLCPICGINLNIKNCEHVKKSKKKDITVEYQKT